MGIIITYVFKNMWEKKLRSLLILFSILISCGLFFASSAISDTFAQMYIDRMKIYYGETDLLIEPQANSPSQILNTGRLSGNENIDLAVGVFYSSGTYRFHSRENINLTMMGIDWNELQSLNPVNIIQESSFKPFTGMKIVLGKDFCEKYGFSAGDSINLTINGSLRKFRIAAVATGGNFINDGLSTYAVLPLETLSAFYNARGGFNRIQVKLKDNVPVLTMIDELSKTYNGYRVVEPFDSEDIIRQVNDITTPFMLMTLFVAFMSTFIIFTSFKVITMERLPVIGTFRSIGATRKTTDYIMMAESFLYGVVGSSLGLGLGMIVLRVMSELMKSPWERNMQATTSFSVIHLITSFLFGLILCFISSFIPILQASKIPLKDIILNTMDKAVNKNSIRLIAGLLLIAAAAILPSYTPKNAAIVLNTLYALMAIAATILLVPFITGLAVRIFERLYVFLFGNIGVLAAKNLRENKSILNNISLLSIGISSLLLINIISYSVSVEVIDFYSKARFDMYYSSNALDSRMERLLRTVDGVIDTTGIYELNGVEVNGHNTPISTLVGINYREYFDYWDFPIQKGSENKLPQLEEERAIFLTHILKDRFDVEQGDFLILKMNNRELRYKVAGFINSLYNNGNLALISDKYFRLDTGRKNFSTVYLKTDRDPEIVADALKKQMSYYYPWTMTLHEMEENNRKTNDQMFVLLKGFSLMAMLIGIIGVVNNLLISFIQRKRSLAIFRSIGMEKMQTVKMVLIEALTGGIIGGIGGILTGLLMIYIVEFLMVSINLPIAMHYPLETILASGLAGLFIMLVSSVGPSIKSSGLNIIEAIKYE